MGIFFIYLYIWFPVFNSTYDCTKKSPTEIQRGFFLFVALEDAVDSLLGEFLGEQTHDNHHGEATYHGDGTTVDGVDGIANEHVDHCEAYTPNEASPDVTPRQ